MEMERKRLFAEPPLCARQWAPKQRFALRPATPPATRVVVFTFYFTCLSNAKVVQNAENAKKLW